MECKDSAGEVLSQGSGFYLKNYGLLSCHHVFENVQYTHIEVRNLYDMDRGYYHISQEDFFSEDKTIDYVQFLSEKISQVPYFYEGGGVVLNTRFVAIGMIRGRNPSNVDCANEFESGFTPLFEILKHISSTLSI